MHRAINALKNLHEDALTCEQSRHAFQAYISEDVHKWIEQIEKTLNTIHANYH